MASYDEDTTTLGFEAARIALKGAAHPDALWFATAEPAYLEKTNACAIHAALQLPSSTTAFDAGGAVRSGINCLRAALRSTDSVLVIGAGIRTGLPTSADEATGGDGGAAVLLGTAAADALVAEFLGAGCDTLEVLDRWRTPADPASKQWEERFGESYYPRSFSRAWAAALEDAGVSDAEVDTIVLTGMHPRAIGVVARQVGKDRVRDELKDSVGNTGAGHAFLLLSAALDEATPNQLIALVTLADGADVLIFRTTSRVQDRRSNRPIEQQISIGGDIEYSKFLQWRGNLAVQPPNRPLPNRISAPAAARHSEWKYAFVGARGDASGLVQLPPSQVSLDESDTLMTPIKMADTEGTIATCTVDRLAFSPSPPVVFAVVDFDGGGRLPIEMTDIDAEHVHPGDRVELTFRRLSTADGIHNYFWKARPARGS